MKNGNRLTIYCNYDISPIKTTTYINGMPPDSIEKVFKVVEGYIPLSSLPYETAMAIVRDYFNLCFKPSPAIESLDPDGYTIQNLDITKYSLQPTRLLGLCDLILDAYIAKLVNKHVRVNVNSGEFVDKVRYAIWEEKLDPKSVTINVLTSSAGVQTYGLNNKGKPINLDNEIEELPQEFTAPDLDILMRMA